MSKTSNISDNVKNSAYGDFGDFKLIINELDRNEDIFEFKTAKGDCKNFLRFLAKQVGFEFEEPITTNQLGRDLIKFLNEKSN